MSLPRVSPRAHSWVHARTWARAHPWIIALVAVLGLCSLAVVFGTLWLERSLPQTIAARTGRKIEVRGPIEVHLLSLRPSVVAHRVTIGNPPWMPPGTTAELDSVRAVLAVPLPFRSLTIESLELTGARLHLVRDAEGRANWQMRDPRRGRGKPEAMIHGLVAPRAQVVLDDSRRHLQFKGVVTAEEVPSRAGALKISGAGELNGRAATFEILGDPLATADRDRPYRFTFQERSDSAQLSARGTLLQPFDVGLMDAKFAASGKTLRDLYRMTGLGLPETDRFSLTGTLERRHERSTFSDLQARFGESDVAGTVVLATEKGVRRFEADLHAATFRLKDIGMREGREVAPSPAGKKPLLSDTQLPLHILKNRVGSLSFEADRVLAGPMTFGSFAARGTLGDGVLDIPSLEWRLDDARFAGNLEIDVTGSTPTTNLDLSIAGLPVSRLSRKAWKQPPLDGRLHARIHIDGDGNSLRQFASTADGTITAVMPKGSMRASLAELTGVNLRGIGLVLAKDSRDTEVRCAVASFEGLDGLFKARQLLVDTDAVLIRGGGSIDLRTESVDLTFRGEQKKLRLGRVRSPLHVRGPLRSPSFSLDAGSLMAQTGEAALLGIALTPMAAALALVDPGLAKDANCAELVKR